jgi:hypothetical protein
MLRLKLLKNLASFGQTERLALFLRLATNAQRTSKAEIAPLRSLKLLVDLASFGQMAGVTPLCA